MIKELPTIIIHFLLVKNKIENARNIKNLTNR
jgi:hypothetical protein